MVHGNENSIVRLTSLESTSKNSNKCQYYYWAKESPMGGIGTSMKNDLRGKREDRNSNKLADLCANYTIFSDFLWEDISFNKLPLASRYRSVSLGTARYPLGTARYPLGTARYHSVSARYPLGTHSVPHYTEFQYRAVPSSGTEQYRLPRRKIQWSGNHGEKKEGNEKLSATTQREATKINRNRNPTDRHRKQGTGNQSSSPADEHREQSTGDANMQQPSGHSQGNRTRERPTGSSPAGGKQPPEQEEKPHGEEEKKSKITLYFVHVVGVSNLAHKFLIENASRYLIFTLSRFMLSPPRSQADKLQCCQNTMKEKTTENPKKAKGSLYKETKLRNSRSQPPASDPQNPTEQLGGNRNSRCTSENFSNMERLAQETLDLTSTSNSKLIIFTELIHSKNCNDILKDLYSDQENTVIGDPVFNTLCPRTSPSVPSMAIVLTMFSPKCCATSNTRRIGLSSTSRAVRIGGSPSSNRTSTTAPITWHTRPTAPAPVNSSVTLPLGPPEALAGDGGEGAGAAAAVAYSTARERRKPMGEGREIWDGMGGLGLGKEDLGDEKRREEARSKEARIRREAMASES
ncbi:hypothetical protein M5K25_026643 [Dendrobium thyrsiflorum]|uniref:Uncharacterized protein n=1 Tax=Dendrobium thyrsiflorum TaxID=117978 RepID=A0ABD0TXQ5_DENTH